MPRDNYPEPGTLSERALIERSLLLGVQSRASTLCYSFAVSFTVFGFSSLEFIQKFDPAVTLWNNLWPRVLFNGLPFLGLGLYLKYGKSEPKAKAMLWAFALPLLLTAASMVHVWPLMWSGQIEIYHFVHAANVFIVAMALVYAGAPAKIMWIQLGALVFFFLSPLVWMVFRAHDPILLNHFFGDWSIVFPATAFVSLASAKVRREIATMNAKIKQDTTAHLGAVVAKSIFEQNQTMAKGLKASGFILKMDIRGFTGFQKVVSEDVFKKMMSGYHSLTSRNISEHGGFWHRSDGDAQLGSFGIMNDNSADLSDLGLGEGELAETEHRQKQEGFRQVLKATFKILTEFYQLKESLGVEVPFELGISIDFGEVELAVQGDGVHRKQWEMSGRVLTRSARLEEYSKVLRHHVAPGASVIVLSPDLADLDEAHKFSVLEINQASLCVRDFPEIKRISYLCFLGKAADVLAAANKVA